jgi:hypothetical protein
LVDHAVDPSVTAPTDSTSPLLDAAITHRYQHVQDGLLKKVRTRGSESFDQLCCNLCTETRNTCVDLFDWVKIRTPFGFLARRHVKRVGTPHRNMVAISTDLPKVNLIEAVRMLGKQAPPNISDGV